VVPRASRLHVDDPVAGPGVGGDRIEEVGTAQGVTHRAAKDRREDVAGEEEIAVSGGDPACTVGRESAAGDQDVDVRVIPQILGPGVQDGEDRRAGAEVAGIGGEGEQGLGGGAQERVVHRSLVRAGHRAEGVGQGKRNQEVGAGQETRAVAIEPASRLLAVALGTVPIATRVVAVLGLVAVVAPAEMPAAGGGATGGEVIERPTM